MIYGLEDRGCRSSSAAHSEYLHLVIDGLDALDDLDGDDLGQKTDNNDDAEMTLNPSALTLVLGSIISTHSAAAWFILLPLNPQLLLLLLLLLPKGFSFSSNLLHCPPTCCLALWTSRFTDTHITTPSRRFSENRINLDSLLISYIY